MAHMMKHTKAACGHMFAHYDRECEHISNENIDTQRTHLNYNLAVHQQLSQGEFVKQRCSQVHCQNRKDVNVMVSWVVTAPKNLPEQEHGHFFKATYDFLQNRYGKENVVSAYVHMDEITPHMHFAFVPVIYDQKKDRYKVSAKEAVGRPDLQTFHADLSKHLELALGHEVDILNEVTKNGNKTVRELKREAAAKEIEDLKQERKQLLFQQKKEFGRYEDLQIEVGKIQDTAVKTVMPGFVALKKKDFEQLKEQAKAYVVNREEINDIRQHRKALADKEKKLEKEKAALAQERAKAVQKQKQADAAYQRQLNLNLLLEKEEEQRKHLKEELKAKEQQLISKEKELEWKDTCLDSVNYSYRSLSFVLAHTVAAIKTLPFTGLSQNQNELVQAISRYAEDKMAQNGHHEAQDAIKEARVCTAIKMQRPPEKPPISRKWSDHGFDR